MVFSLKRFGPRRPADVPAGWELIEDVDWEEARQKRLQQSRRLKLAGFAIAALSVIVTALLLKSGVRFFAGETDGTPKTAPKSKRHVDI